MGKIGKLVSRAWGVEESVIDDTPKLSYVLGDDLMVENHGGIDGITEERVSFASGIEVGGKGLEIVWIEKDLAVIRGVISEIVIKMKGKS